MSWLFSARQGEEPDLRARWSAYLQERRAPFVIALAYLTLITVAELLTTFIEQRVELALVGLGLHAGLLAILVVHTALASGHPYHRLLLTLSIVPLIRMLDLSIALSMMLMREHQIVELQQVYWYLIISIPLFVATFLAMRTLGFSRDQLGLTVGKVRLQFLVGLTGFILGGVEYYILRLEPLVSSFSWQSVLVASLILMVCTGFAEELIFRGVMQRASVQALGRFGLLYVALLFAAMHVGYRSLLDVVFVFGVALFFGWVVEQTKSLVGVSLAHGLTNIVLFLIMPFVA